MGIARSIPVMLSRRVSVVGASLLLASKNCTSTALQLTGAVSVPATSQLTVTASPPTWLPLTGALALNGLATLYHYQGEVPKAKVALDEASAVGAPQLLVDVGMAGAGKFFVSMGLPEWFAWVVMLYETIGGLMLILGVFATSTSCSSSLLLKKTVLPPTGSIS